MNTREVAAEYRLTHWAGIMRRRSESGQSIKIFCEREGIHENTYYYWQRKLREAACRGMELREAAYREATPGNINNNEGNRSNKGQGSQTTSLVPAVSTNIPPGWTVCKINQPEAKEDGVYIEIGKCRLKATAETDTETLARICRVLVTIC